MELSDFALCLEDPILFAEQVLHQRLSEQQKQLARAVRDFPRVCCLSGHSLGKSHLAAILLLWFVARGGCAITSSASQRQVVSVLWRNVRAFLAKDPPPEFDFGQCNQASLQLSADCWAMGFSSGSEDQGVKFQGFKFPGEGLIILDEAVGLAPEVFEGVESIRAGGNVHVLVLANPTISAGPVYELARSGSYHTIYMSCFDSENFKYRDFTPAKLKSLPRRLPETSPEFEFDPQWPFLARPAWAYQLYCEWGEESPVFAPRVLGQWPSQSADSLISLNSVNEAISRWRPESVEGPETRPAYAPLDERVEFGVDVARYGSNSSVVIVRRGSRVLQIESWRGHDLMETTGRIVLLARHWHPEEIQVDEIGVGGGVRDRLRELGLPVTGITVGGHSPDDKFINLRAFAYWHLRDLFRQGAISIPRNARLQRDLTGLRYEIRSDSKIKIESKEDAGKRGIESPDFGDALVLAFWPGGHGPGALYEYYRGRAAGEGQSDDYDAYAHQNSQWETARAQERAAQGLHEAMQRRLNTNNPRRPPGVGTSDGGPYRLLLENARLRYQ